MTTPTSSAAVRAPAVAGLFYRDDADGLRREVREFVESGNPSALVPRAVIVPHAGYVYSGAVAGSGYRVLGNLDRSIRRVYLLGPAHRVHTRGVAAPSHQRFATPLGEVRIDQKAISELARRFDFISISDQSHAEEHSLEVHLPFLQTVLDDFVLVPLVVGEVHPQRLKTLIDEILDTPDALLVVSSDLSHYHAYDEAKLIDAQTVACMEQLAWDEMRPERACGFIPVSALLLSAAEHGYDVSALDVRNSGDTAGGRDRVVGYASLVIHEPGDRLDGETRSRLLALARDAIVHELDARELALDPADWPRSCRALAASFVTVNLEGELRGCVGTLVPEEPLVHSVANNAVRAAFQDPRFAPLTSEELIDARISISILSPVVPMKFSSQDDLLSQLQPSEDGLILSCGSRRGTFLPSVWESLPTPETFLAGLKRKASLPEDFWSDEIRIERYRTETFGES
jgi:MEMO1 family protein